MKIKLLIILLFITQIFTSLDYCQDLTNEERQAIIAKLDSASFRIRVGAINDIVKYQIAEAVPSIEAKIWKQEPSVQFQFIDALLIFDSSRAREIILKIIDSAGNYSLREFALQDSVQIRVHATWYLFKLNDYSTVNYVFKMLERDKPKTDYWALDLLKKIILNVPDLADSAKAELHRILRTGNFHSDRYRALRDLFDLYGQEIIPDLTYIIRSDPDPQGSIRIRAMMYLFQLQYPLMQSLLRERLTNEVAAPYREVFAESLLVHFGAASDYKYVSDYLPGEPDTTTRLLVNLALQSFLPPIPKSDISTQTLIDSLIQIEDEVQAYSWLGDQNLVIELDSNLTNAKNYLLSGDSSNCYRQIKIFQHKLDEEYRDSLDGDTKRVTIEGWKFLYYNAQYILARLSVPPPQNRH